jgi:hypothetical protein
MLARLLVQSVQQDESHLQASRLVNAMTALSREELIRLAEAKPTTEFEKVAAAMRVMVSSHNGGAPREKTMWDVLKYPNAFSLDTLRVMEEWPYFKD